MKNMTVCAAILGVTATAEAIRFSFQQITETPSGWGMFEPSITADGTRLAFSAAYDFTGGNPENNFEIYVYDVPEETFIQLTDTPSGSGNFQPMITPDGAHVVFRAAFDYVGENPDFSFELFEVDVADGEIRQVTDNPGGIGLFQPVLSADGAYLAYRSNGDPVGLNGDHSFEIFRQARLGSSIEQVTATTGPANFEPTINGDGSRIAWRAAHNFDGSNPEGNIEVWRWDAAAGYRAVTVTPTGTLNELPSVDASGDRIAFISRFDFTGENPTGTLEIYVADMSEAITTYQQATKTGPLLHLEPVMSPDGTLVIFESQRNPLGENPDQNREIFAFDVVAGQLHQLTKTTGGVSIPQLSDRAEINYAAISTGGKHFAIRNEHDLDGANPGGNLELFLARRTITGDISGDGVVDVVDLVALLAAWGGCPPPPADCPADLNGDGVVDVTDLLILLQQWGARSAEIGGAAHRVTT